MLHDALLVSILIATRNRPEALLRCLESVATQTHPRIEILVIDDASDVPLDLAALRNAAGSTPLRCLRTDDRIGPVGCRNRLMREARGDVFVILDDDAELAGADGVATAVAALTDDPGTGVLAFRIVDHGPGGDRLLLPYGRCRLRRHPELADRPGLVGHYLAGGHALRRAVRERIGDFDDALCYGHEELDLSYRAVDAGCAIRYVPAVVVDHYRDASAGLSGWKLYHLVRNRLVVALRYLPARFLPVHLSAWILGYAILAYRHQVLEAYVRGVRDGLSRRYRLDRRPLSSAAVAYLKKHYGRLWY